MVRREWLVYLALLASALAAFLAMKIWTLPEIEPGGVPSFDTRKRGYTLDEARALITGLGADGREIYLGLQRILDTVFPAAITSALSLGLYLTMRKVSRELALTLTPLPLVFFAFDMLENHAVAGLLRTDVLTADMVAAASQWTQLKWHAVNACLALLAICIGVRALGWVINRVRA